MKEYIEHPKRHLGANIRRYRELYGISQEELATRMGDDWTQRRISLLEANEEVEPLLLGEVAKALETKPNVIKHFSDQAIMNYINNLTEATFNDHSTANPTHNFGTQNINTGEKWLEALEEIKRLNEELKQLYELRIKEKDEMIAVLRGLLERK